MKRSDAERNHNTGYKSIEGQNCLSHMQSLTSVYWTVDDQYESGKALIKCQAETAYEMADAMLEARNK